MSSSHLHPELDERIRVQAYHLWESAGRPPGDGQHFWLEAERLILRMSPMQAVKHEEADSAKKPQRSPVAKAQSGGKKKLAGGKREAPSEPEPPLSKAKKALDRSGKAGKREKAPKEDKPDKKPKKKKKHD